MATPQPSLTPPSTRSSGTNTSSRKTSAKPSSPSRRSTPRTVTPSASSGHQQVGHAAVAGGVGVGAEQPEQPVAERAAGGPGLLAVEHPAAAVVVAGGPALDAGEVGAGVGLGPALAPQVLGRRHPGQEAGLLLVGAELEDGRGEQEDAVLGDPLGTARPVVLLLEDQPLPQRGAPAAVLLGPRHDRPPGLEELLLPLDVQGEALRRVARRQAASGTLASSQSRASARKASSASVKFRSTATPPVGTRSAGDRTPAPDAPSVPAHPSAGRRVDVTRTQPDGSSGFSVPCRHRGSTLPDPFPRAALTRAPSTTGDHRDDHRTRSHDDRHRAGHPQVRQRRRPHHRARRTCGRTACRRSTRRSAPPRAPARRQPEVRRHQLHLRHHRLEPPDGKLADFWCYEDIRVPDAPHHHRRRASRPRSARSSPSPTTRCARAAGTRPPASRTWTSTTPRRRSASRPSPASAARPSSRPRTRSSPSCASRPTTTGWSRSGAAAPAPVASSR